MINQFIDIIKDTTISAVVLVMGLFGASDASFLTANDAHLSDFAQANISETLNSENEEMLDSEVIHTEDVFADTSLNSDTTYFEKEDLPEAIFTRPDSSEDNLITLGEESIDDVRAINPIKSSSKKLVDASLILETNIDEFDFKLQIAEITEDDSNFFVAYQYKTLAVEDKVWKEVLKEKNISITKKNLGGEDLGDYLSEELAEVVENEIVYLKEVQGIQIIKKEKADRLAQIEVEETRITTTDYSSLIGRVLNVGDTDFGDYEPVVKDDEITEIPTVSEVSVTEIPDVPEDNTTSTGVVDNQAPLLVVQGNNPALVQIGSSYVDLGAKVTDNISEGLGVKIGGDVVDTATKGSYFITYTATDEAGNIATASREVIVYDYGITPDVEQEVEVIPEPEEEIDIIPEPDQDESITTPSDIVDEEVDEKDKKDKDKDDKTIVEVVVDVVDNSAEVVQETVDAIVETTAETITESVDAVVEVTGGVVDASAEAVQETVDATMEVVGDSVDNIVETTNDIAEQVTAMISSINLRELLGSVGSSVDLGMGDKINSTLSNVGSFISDNVSWAANKVYDLTNTLLEKIKSIFRSVWSLASDTVSYPYSKTKEAFTFTTNKINNTAQILSSGAYEIIGDLADNFYYVFNFIFDKVKGASQDTVVKISNGVDSVSDKVSSVVGKSSLAGVKYAQESVVEESINLEESELDQSSETNLFKEKITTAGRFMKYSLNRTLDFFKKNKPAI